MTPSARQRRAIFYMLGAVSLFALQDGFSRYLAERYPVFFVIMVRYWVFAAFVLLLARRQAGAVGGWRAAVGTDHLGLHVLRAGLLIAEICVIVWGYTLIGLINSHAVFATCPLIVAALSGPLLGERVAPRTWAAIGLGFAGVLVILRPGAGVFSLAALLPLSAAVMFALYSLLTRKAAQSEGAFKNLFWSGLLGGIMITALGLPFLRPMPLWDGALLAVYALIAVLANWLLIRCYDLGEAGRVQPFAYLQIVLVTLMGMFVFGEVLQPAVALGAALVVCGGLFAWWSEERRPALNARAEGP